MKTLPLPFGERKLRTILKEMILPLTLNVVKNESDYSYNVITNNLNNFEDIVFLHTYHVNIRKNFSLHLHSSVSYTFSQNRLVFFRDHQIVPTLGVHATLSGVG